MAISEQTASSAHVDPEAELNHILYRMERLTRVDWHQHSGAIVDDFVFTIEQIDRRLAYLRSKVLNVAEADGLWALGGARTVTTWLSNMTGATRASASRAIKVSRAMRDHLPYASQALGDGRIGAEHAQILAREVTRTRALVGQLEDESLGEGFLVDSAATMGAGEFAQVAKRWAAMTDPEAAERNWREVSAKDEFFLSPSTDHYFISGQLNKVSGKLLEEALSAQMGRKGQDDDRPPAERRAAALVELAQGWLDSGELLPGARIRPHLTVTVPLPTLHALCEATGSAIPNEAMPEHGLPDAEGAINPADWVKGWATEDGHVISTSIDFAKLVGVEPASLEDGTVIPPSVLARLACDSRLMRVVFGPESTVLDAGRSKRIFPANQTRAIIARDRHCQYPQCDEPPEHGEIHHSLWWWKHGGKTSVDHGILLCWWHHAHVHDRNITIMRRRGKWIFVDQQGLVIPRPGERSVLQVGDVTCARPRDAARSAAPNLPDPPYRASTDGDPFVQIEYITDSCTDTCYHPTEEEMRRYQMVRPENDPWGRDIHELWEQCRPKPPPPPPDLRPWDEM